MNNKDVLKQITDAIIPEGDQGEPPASATEALQRVSELVRNNRAIKARIEALNVSGCLPASLSEWETEDSNTFEILLQAVYMGYYSDESVIKKLNLPGPPQPAGHKMKPFDMSIFQ